MSGGNGKALRELRDHPFELLKELERRSQVALAGSAGEGVQATEWVGIGFRLGAEQFIVPRDEVREVLMVPGSITRVPGAKAWLKGLANVRGHLLPLVDLRAFLGAGAGGTGRSARVLVINGGEYPAGILVDEVSGFRRFLESEHSQATPETMIRCEQYLAGSFERDGDLWPVFSAQRLVGADEFFAAASEQPAGSVAL